MTSPTPLPHPSIFPTLPPATVTALLDTLFEPSPPLHTLVLPLLTSHQPYSTYPSLIVAIHTRLLSLLSSTSPTDRDTLTAILSAHPRLGAKKVDSALSRGEQANLQGGEEEARRLAELNEDYERAFPGLRYVVFVNGRGRGEVMRDMEARIARGDGEAERREGIKAMCDIAADRAAKLGQEEA